jgi:hypothetical protein
MTPTDFRDFVFENPARFYTDSNPNFFADTVVADAVARRGSEEKADTCPPTRPQQPPASKRSPV